MRLAALLTAIFLLAVASGCSGKKSTQTVGSQPTRRIELQPKKRAKAPTKKTTTAAVVSPTPTRPPAEESVPPALQAMTTPEEHDALAKAAMHSIVRARNNLSVLKVRGSAAMRAHEIGRVESFVRQAEAALDAHRVTSARDLAERAEVLSQDLLNR